MTLQKRLPIICIQKSLISVRSKSINRTLGWGGGYAFFGDRMENEVMYTGQTDIHSILYTLNKIVFGLKIRSKIKTENGQKLFRI